jgi:hypothetical protein
MLRRRIRSETTLPGYRMESYWRNEQLGQPPLDGAQRRYLISGDGALVDLCRLTIERFRQDTIVYELFGNDLEEVESRFADAMHLLRREANVPTGSTESHLRLQARRGKRLLPTSISPLEMGVFDSFWIMMGGQYFWKLTRKGSFYS